MADRFILDGDEDYARKRYEELEYKHNHLGGGSDTYYSIYLDEMAELYPKFHDGEVDPTMRLLEMDDRSKFYNKEKEDAFWKKSNDDYNSRHPEIKKKRGCCLLFWL
jgi:hypothetical protein